MKIVFHLAHPAHFHLFKLSIANLRENGSQVLVTYNDKDVLEDLIKDSGFRDISRKVRTIKDVSSGWKLKLQFLQKNLGLFRILLGFRPDVVIGTSVIITLVGRLLRYDSIIVNEDDFDVVQQTAKLGYPFATHILCPWVCRTGEFDAKCLKYHSYHELAYLHPNHFTPDASVVEPYFPADEPFFIIRFAKLSAHHDVGIKGIDTEMALEIIRLLEPRGKVYISSEPALHPSLEPYRIRINPKDIHHVIAFARLYIGDSQTMAAEAGVLGTAFIRFNGFVGRLSYLDELENEYKLGRGIHVDEREQLIPAISEFISDPALPETMRKRREAMLAEKVDYSALLTRFLAEYPASIAQWESWSPDSARSRKA